MFRPPLPRLVWPCAWLPDALALSIHASAQVTTPPHEAAAAAASGKPSRPVPCDCASRRRCRRPRQPRRVATRRCYVPGEFEQFVQRLAGAASLIRRRRQPSSGGATTPESRCAASAPNSLRAPSMAAARTSARSCRATTSSRPGDEILLTIWGSVDADLRLVVDRGGRISVPRVGAIQVAGVRSADLPARHRAPRRAGVQELPAQRLAGAVAWRPRLRHRLRRSGPARYTVSALSTVVGALMRAGGPSAAGSFRQHRAQARRRGDRTFRPLRPAAQGRPLGRPPGAGRRRGARRRRRDPGRRDRQRQPARGRRTGAGRDRGRRAAHGRRLLGGGRPQPRGHRTAAGTHAAARGRIAACRATKGCR